MIDSHKSRKGNEESIQPQIAHLLSGGGNNIPLFKVHMPEDAIVAATEVLRSGYIGQGPRVATFEENLGERLGNKNVLTTNSGTSALQLALRLANVGMGDEVISTPMTCTATNMPILAAGAKIVWADINPYTGNIDILDVERKITPRTKAVMAVHWGGLPCDIGELNLLAKKYNLKIIEDAAHALGSTYQGQTIGAHSDFICFSFQAIKHITTIDGGALLCRRTEDYKRGKLLRWYGIDREADRKDFRCEEDIAEWGYKFHMNDVAASLGIAQLRHLDVLVAKHQSNARIYRDALEGLKGVTLLEDPVDRESSYWLFTLLVDSRIEFMKWMNAKGITVSQVHARNDHHTCFASFASVLPGVTQFVEKQVSIPVGWWLSEPEIDYIVQTIHEFSNRPMSSDVQPV